MVWHFLTTTIALLCWTLELGAQGKSSLLQGAVSGETKAIIQAAEKLSPEGLNERLAKQAPMLAPACKPNDVQVTGSSLPFDGLFDFSVDEQGMLHAVFSAGTQHGYQRLFYRVGKGSLWSKATEIFPQRSMDDHVLRVLLRLATDNTVYVAAILGNVKDAQAQQKLVMIERHPKKGWQPPQVKSALIPDPSTASAAVANNQFHVAWQMNRQDGVGLMHAHLRDQRVRLRKIGTGIPGPGGLFSMDGKLYGQFNKYFIRFLNGKWTKRKKWTDHPELEVSEVTTPMLAAERLDPRAPVANALSLNIYTGGVRNRLRPKWAMSLPNLPIAQRRNISLGWTSIKEPAALFARGPHLFLARPGNPTTLGSPVHFGAMGTAAYGVKMHLNGNQMRAMWAEISSANQIKIKYCDANLKAALWSPLNKIIWMATAGRGMTASDRTLLAEYLSLVGQRDWQTSKAETALTSFLHALQTVAQPAQAPHASNMVQRIASTQPQLFLKTLLGYARKFPTTLRPRPPGAPGSMVSGYLSYFAVEPNETYHAPKPDQYDDVAAAAVMQIARKFPDLYGNPLCVAIEQRDPGPRFLKQVPLKNVRPMSRCPKPRGAGLPGSNLVTLRWIRWLSPKLVKVSSLIMLQGTSTEQLDVFKDMGNGWQPVSSHKASTVH